jgi:hypothetical protein
MKLSCLWLYAYTRKNKLGDMSLAKKILNVLMYMQLYNFLKFKLNLNLKFPDNFFKTHLVKVLKNSEKFRVFAQYTTQNTSYM